MVKLDRKVLFLLSVIVFFVIFSVLMVLFWAFVSDKILIPLYYILWVCGLIANSIPQRAYLALLVLLSIIISSSTIDGLQINPRRTKKAYSPPDSGTRYMQWRILCFHDSSNWFTKGQLAFEARHLILSIVAFEQSVNLEEAESMVRSGKVDVPEILRTLIEKKSFPNAPSNHFPGGLSWWFGKKAAHYEPYVKQFLAELIHYAEHHLEIIPHVDNQSEI
jgi:hypothetical protein